MGGSSCSNKLKRNMRCSIFALSLAIVYASASPIADSVVPEDSHYAVDDDLSEAQQKINQMTAAGASDKDCRKLVTETRKEVQTNVDSCQKIMDGMPKGEQCVNLGQDHVKAATEAKSKADKHLVTTTTEVTRASSAKVDFGSRSFSSLTEGKCDSFYSSGVYTTAKTTYTAAVTAQTKAKGAAEEAAKTLTKLIAAAAKAKLDCECKTKHDHERAFATHGAADAANQKAWSFACKVECVLDGKTTCTCSAAPKCKAATLIAAVNAATCATPPTPAPTPNKAGNKAAEEAKKKAAEEAKKKAAEEAKKAAAAAAAAKAQREAAERHQKSFSCKCKMVDYRGACRGYRADAEPNFCPGRGQANCANAKNGFGEYPCMWSNQSPGKFRL